MAREASNFQTRKEMVTGFAFCTEKIVTTAMTINTMKIAAIYTPVFFFPHAPLRHRSTGQSFVYEVVPNNVCRNSYLQISPVILFCRFSYPHEIVDFGFPQPMKCCANADLIEIRHPPLRYTPRLFNRQS